MYIFGIVYIIAFLPQGAPYVVVSKTALPNAKCWNFTESALHFCVSETIPKNFEGIVNYEEDGPIHKTGCQFSPEWHLSRISQRKADYKKPYAYDDLPFSGIPPSVYVVDTYVQINHPHFQGRASLGFANVHGYLESHGTHVAGLVGSKFYGVCKYAKIISVRVLDDSGSGYFSGLIEGLSWISHNAAPKSIINISISGARSMAMDQAVEALSKQGILVVTAAGNDGKDAQYYSPGGSPNALTVGAISQDGLLSSFSNYGTSVDVIAPGEYIRSIIPIDSVGWMSGTSMASPIVAGAAAVILSSYRSNISSVMLKELVISAATVNQTHSIRFNTPDRIPYIHSISDDCGPRTGGILFQ